MKMTQEAKTKWTDALRSGEYKQGHGSLKLVEDGVPAYCCIGVLCEIQGLPFEETEYGSRLPSGRMGEPELQDWQAMSGVEVATIASVFDSEVFYAHDYMVNDLVRLNDSLLYPFSQIADYIDEHVGVIDG